MDKYRPTKYQKSIMDVDYNKLYKEGIRVLLFDVDNTLVAYYHENPENKVITLIKNLKKKFKILLVSNSINYKKIKRIAATFGVDYMFFAIKPFLFRVRNKMREFSKEETAIIGDQIMTDVLFGNKLGIQTILIDKLSNRETNVTSINRFFEKNILVKLEKEKMFKLGEYYE